MSHAQIDHDVGKKYDLELIFTWSVIRGDVVGLFRRRPGVADAPVDDVCNVVCSLCDVVDAFWRLRRRQVGVNKSLTPWQNLACKQSKIHLEMSEIRNKAYK